MVELVVADWVASLDTAPVLAAAAAVPTYSSAADLAAVAEMAVELAATVDVDAARAAVTDEQPRAIFARHPAGPVLGLRWYVPGEVSTVHHHAWTILVQLDGHGTVERWRAGPSDTATLRSATGMRRGDACRLGDCEVHRQLADDTGSLELVVIADWTDARPVVDVEPAATSEASAKLIHEYRAAFQAADPVAVGALCAGDVLLDVNVPHWRFQTAGREALVDGLRTSEFVPDYRITEHRGRPTADGAVVELECHLTAEGEDRLAREVHLLRCDDAGRVAEVTLFCTGIWSAEAIERQRLHAPMVRR
jgi:hypothetical protein